MGLRLAEPCECNPEGTQASFPFDGGEGQEWYAVQVTPRHEKRVAAALQEKRVTSFLPLITETHCWSDRKQKVQVPLFAGYTFVRLSTSVEERVAVLRTNGVLRLVGREFVGTPIPTKEIEDVWLLINSQLKIDLYPFLNVDDRIRIRTGSLAGVEGVLVRKNSDMTLVVSVNLLHRSVAVRIDGFEVERIVPIGEGRSGADLAA